MRKFETLKPKSKLLQKYISYYYLDIADDLAYSTEYICYPHYNNTISLYKNHNVIFKDKHSIITYQNQASPLQIYTPIRETILKVTQTGAVHKIGIVFNPFGINQFLQNELNMSQRISSPLFNFFSNEFIISLFNEDSFANIIELLDDQLLKKINPVSNQYIEKALQVFNTNYNEFSIDELAELKLGISRKHLTRLFKKYIGTTPQKYRSIVRFRKLMSYKLNQIDEANFTSLSNEVNYADQSHFIKACKQLTGLTPKQFFKEGKIIGSEDTFWNFG